MNKCEVEHPMPRMTLRSVVALVILGGTSLVPFAQGQEPAATYWVYVGAESADLIHRIRFGPEGASVERTIPVGEMAVETEGPHGLRVSPDGQYLYMTTGHGVPDGKLWRFALGADTLVGEPILLGKFPSTLDVSPDGLFAFVANFNLHGEKVPSTISSIYTPDLMEVAQTRTCIQPHGLRVHPDGSRLFTLCVQDDQLIEIDTRTFDVTRRVRLTKGGEGLVDDYNPEGVTRETPRVATTCNPTWAQPTPAGDRLYVACNRGDEVLEFDANSLTILRRFATGRGPYNLAVTPDGETLIATLKPGAAVEFFDLATGTSLGTSPSSTTVTHGVVVSPDSRYAFVSVEGVGAEPGKVDVYEIASREMVASVPVGQQAGGITFWKMEPPVR